ncbi:hypothetical protein TRIUR3_26487 [Triticum urartu]|uniref:Uncharacterized protein n=1 Tax=Triticum urartu TaxID=4572 RepID=M7YQP9_TRIUA|nr:hypothetical protein TRIUR3_26487 [Triticum urartu]
MGKFVRQCDMEVMKMAMLKHEETFRQQMCAIDGARGGPGSEFRSSSQAAANWLIMTNECMLID